MSRSDNYYNLLTRLDHPAFSKDFDSGLDKDDNFNQILNRILAEELDLLVTLVEIIYLDQFPHTVTVDGADDWEIEYFDLLKRSKDIATRRAELMQWINNPIGMSEPDVINLAESIVGKTPNIIINANESGFLIDEAILGESSSLDGEQTTENKYTYIVTFAEIIPSDIARELDKRLTQTEKAGSKHYLVFPEVAWIIDESILGEDTFLR